MSTTVAEHLKSLRTSAGLSQRELAEVLGVSYGLVGMIEKSASPPKPALVEAWRAACGDSPTAADPKRVRAAIEALQREHTHTMLAIALVLLDRPDLGDLLREQAELLARTVPRRDH